MSYIKRMIDDLLEDFENGMSIDELSEKYHQPAAAIADMIELMEEES